jgi:hypothetical protein
MHFALVTVCGSGVRLREWLVGNPYLGITSGLRVIRIELLR